MSETASDLAPSETSDAVLISRIRDGDTTAYGLLYERHLAAGRRLARHLVEGDAAEDAVQETFAKILAVLRRGGGPESGFRPYLLTAIRRTVYDRHRADKRLQHTDQIELFDPGVPFVDPALEGLERRMITRAFRSLPERWQTVLWHTEIEGAKPADVAPLLGLTANGVAALAYRAREGLRQAYLQMHLAQPSATAHPEDATAAVGMATPDLDEECAKAREKLGAYIRDGLAKRESRAVKSHLDRCGDCKELVLDLRDVNTRLREALGPFILGTASAAYLSASGSLTGGGALGWLLRPRWLRRIRRLPKRQQQALATGTGAVAVAGAAALAMTLVSSDRPLPPVRKGPAIARPAPADPPSRPAPKPPAAKPAPPAAAPPPKPKPVVPVPAPAPRKPGAKPEPHKPKPRAPQAPAPVVPPVAPPQLPPVVPPVVPPDLPPVVPPQLPPLVPPIVRPWIPRVELPRLPLPRTQPVNLGEVAGPLPEEPEIITKSLRNPGMGRPANPIRGAGPLPERGEPRTGGFP